MKKIFLVMNLLLVSSAFAQTNSRMSGGGSAGLIQQKNDPSVVEKKRYGIDPQYPVSVDTAKPRRNINLGLNVRY